MARNLLSYYTDPDDDEDKAINALSSEYQPSRAPDMDLTQDPEAQRAGTVPRDAFKMDLVGDSGAERQPDPVEALAGEHADSASSGDDDAPGVSPWAIAADLIFNNGRGLGKIVGMAQQQKQQWLANRSRAKNSAADLELRRGQLGVSQRQNDLRAAELAALKTRATRDQDLRERGIGVRQGNLDLAEQKRGDRLSPDSEFNKTAVAVAGSKSSAQAQGRVDTRHENIDTISQDAAQEAEAKAKAVQPYREDLKTVETPQQRAAAERSERRERRQDERDQHRDQRELRMDAQAHVKEDRAAIDKFKKDSGYATGAKQSLDTLKAMYEKYADDPRGVPGVGVVLSGGNNIARSAYEGFLNLRGRKAGGDRATSDQEYAADTEVAANALKNLKAYSLRKETGAAAPNAETLEMAQRIGTYGMNPDQTAVAMKAIDQLVSGELSGLGIGRERVAREALRRSKIDPELIPLPEGDSEYGQEPWRANVNVGYGGGQDMSVDERMGRSLPEVMDGPVGELGGSKPVPKVNDAIRREDERRQRLKKRLERFLVQ